LHQLRRTPGTDVIAEGKCGTTVATVKPRPQSKGSCGLSRWLRPATEDCAKVVFGREIFCRILVDYLCSTTSFPLPVVNAGSVLSDLAVACIAWCILRVQDGGRAALRYVSGSSRRTRMKWLLTRERGIRPPSLCVRHLHCQETLGQSVVRQLSPRPLL